MEQILQKENNINNSNKQSTLDTNKNSILLYNNGNYFSFGKDNSLNNKLAPNTSSFNIKENIKKVDNMNLNNLNTTNNNSFLNKKRKLMTSEELELEQIERERKEVKKMMQKNMALYYRTKSGTTTIVSKIRDNIYNTNTNNNVNKNTILNNYINNNNTNNNNNMNNNKVNTLFNPNINKNNSYLMNFMKEKGINKINNIDKPVGCDNNINKTEINNKCAKEQIIEIINTDINITDKNSVNKIDNKNENIIDLYEEKEKEKEKEGINNIDECNNEDIEKESEIENVEKDDIIPILAIKTPNKESSYLTKMKKLGSMSKLSLCNKIEKYTEICKEVLKEQEGEGEGEENNEEKRKEKKEKKRKKKNKKSKSKK